MAQITIIAKNNSIVVNGLQCEKGRLSIAVSDETILVNNINGTLSEVTINGNSYGTMQEFVDAADELLFEYGGGAPGEGVQSVTGDLVDNTDPRNPVVNLHEWVNYSRIDRLERVLIDDVVYLHNLSNLNIDRTEFFVNNEEEVESLTLVLPRLEGVTYKRRKLYFNVKVQDINVGLIGGVNMNSFPNYANEGDVWTMTYCDDNLSWRFEGVSHFNHTERLEYLGLFDSLSDFTDKYPTGNVNKYAYVRDVDSTGDILRYYYWSDMSEEWMPLNKAEDDVYASGEVVTNKIWINGKKIYRRLFHNEVIEDDGSVIISLAGIGVTEVTNFDYTVNENGTLRKNVNSLDISVTNTSLTITPTGVPSVPTSVSIILEYTK